MERNVTKREILLKRQKKPFQTLDDLVDACLATLTARIWATCRWLGDTPGAWKIGDFNYLIASVEPDTEGSLFVQFWSEPAESVCAEISSGEWTPGALKYVGKLQRELIEAPGYTVGGRARNFEKELRIDTSADAETTAREVLRVFFEVFGYRGQWPLELEWHQGERAEHDAVYSSLTPEDFGKVAAQCGFEVDGYRGKQPALKLSAGKAESVVGFYDQIPDNNLYSVVVLETLVASPAAIDDHKLAQALDQILHASPGAITLSDVEERSPYPGLRSFTEEDAAVFFGREEDVTVTRMVTMIRQCLAHHPDIPN